LIWALLESFDLQYAAFFGVLAFLLNYIPSIGSFIASFPALFVAILQLNMIDASMIAVGYVIINISVGNFLDPKIMGKDLGLSTFIVFTSMVIWGWILGPMGMFLAVPLTIAIKIVCDNTKKCSYISVILTDKLIENKDLKKEKMNEKNPLFWNFLFHSEFWQLNRRSHKFK
jgi:AI-2 transport protein TqsA